MHIPAVGTSAGTLPFSSVLTFTPVVETGAAFLPLCSVPTFISVRGTGISGLLPPPPTDLLVPTMLCGGAFATWIKVITATLIFLVASPPAGFQHHLQARPGGAILRLPSLRCVSFSQAEFAAGTPGVRKPSRWVQTGVASPSAILRVEGGGILQATGRGIGMFAAATSAFSCSGDRALFLGGGFPFP